MKLTCIYIYIYIYIYLYTGISDMSICRNNYSKCNNVFEFRSNFNLFDTIMIHFIYA